jgi:SAM-dependent methyltransferase
MPSAPPDHPLRLLVVIACYGDKNLPLLRKVIAAYQSLPTQTRIVVTSNNPKDLGPTVEVVVGLPTKDPWSLPFAHKRILAENVANYDLFIYSEDDMLVTWRNIEAFLSLSAKLPPDEIAGFLRYETNDSGERSFPDFQSAYHWRPASVCQRGDQLVAEFSNEHSAFYLLSQAQLRRAIDSGGFLRPPCVGRYDMACTAATDPYLTCGFKKVVCLSSIEDFLVHHLSNRYFGIVGIPAEEFHRQVQTLVDTRSDPVTAETLCNIESGMPCISWSHDLYASPAPALLALLPADARTVLTIPCGLGKLETKLKEEGRQVTGLAHNVITASRAREQGVEIISGPVTRALSNLQGRTFDCIILSNILHLLPDPWSLLETVASLVRTGGRIICLSPNFSAPQVELRRLLRRRSYHRLSSYEQSGINRVSSHALSRFLHKRGFALQAPTFLYSKPRNQVETARTLRERVMAQDWLVAARKTSPAAR